MQGLDNMMDVADTQLSALGWLQVLHKCYRVDHCHVGSTIYDEIGLHICVIHSAVIVKKRKLLFSLKTAIDNAMTSLL